MSDLVRIEKRDAVAIITLDRPNALNALSAELVGQIVEALHAVSGVRAVVLSGSERAFCAGADISQIAMMRELDPVERLAFDDLFETLAGLPIPTIAAVRGLAFGGGCELVLACDTAIAGESAKFALPEVKLGVIPGAGGTQRLVHAIGKAKAMRMLLSGEPVDAQWALHAGLVADVVEDSVVLDQAVALAETIAANGPLAAALAVDSARRAQQVPLDQGLLIERRNFQLALRSEDAAEGTSAFVEKRTPMFRGR